MFFFSVSCFLNRHTVWYVEFDWNHNMIGDVQFPSVDNVKDRLLWKYTHHMEFELLDLMEFSVFE